MGTERGARNGNVVTGHRDGHRKGNKALGIWLWCIGRGTEGSAGRDTVVMEQRMGTERGPIFGKAVKGNQGGELRGEQGYENVGMVYRKGDRGLCW